MQHVAHPAGEGAAGVLLAFRLELAEQQLIAKLEVAVVLAHVEGFVAGLHGGEAIRPDGQLVVLVLRGVQGLKLRGELLGEDDVGRHDNSLIRGKAAGIGAACPAGAGHGLGLS